MLAKAMIYVLIFSRLTRPSTGLSLSFITRLYIVVYVADVWYSPIHQRQNTGRARGLVVLQRVWH